MGHFDGHGGAPMQYGAHCQMQHDQGFTRSHWTPPSGNYLLRITPAATRATIKTSIMQKCTHFAGRFDGHRVAPVLYRAHRPMEEVHGFHGSHYTPPPGKHSLRYYKRDMPTPVVLDISSWKRARVDMLAPNNNRGMTYQTDEKHLNNMSEYFVGVVNTAFNCYNNRFLWRVINQ